MKTRFTSHEIAHIWASGSYTEGRAPANMSFDGDAFFSYSTVIARRLAPNVYVLNCASFSVTTSKHQSAVRRALSSADTVFDFADGNMGTRLEPTGAELFAYSVREAAACAAKAARAHAPWKKESLATEAENWLAQARKVNTYFKLRRKVDSAAVARLTAAEKRAAEKERRAREERKRAYLAERWEKLEMWVAGGAMGWVNFYDLPIRFRIEGEELVSSRGARIPLAAARRAVAFAQSRRARGWDARTSDDVERVGAYRFDAVTPDGVTVGCHDVSWAEVDRVAALLTAMPQEAAPTPIERVAA